MTVVVDWSSDEPVYAQIARQIRGWIASGELAPGFRLPPVRTLASDWGVSLNTVARAYRFLEREGFVRIQERAGAEVSPPARALAEGVRNRLRHELWEVLARMRQAGLSPAELRRVAAQEIDSLAGPPARRRD